MVFPRHVTATQIAKEDRPEAPSPGPSTRRATAPAVGMRWILTSLAAALAACGGPPPLEAPGRSTVALPAEAFTGGPDGGAGPLSDQGGALTPAEGRRLEAIDGQLVQTGLAGTVPGSLLEERGTILERAGRLEEASHAYEAAARAYLQSPETTPLPLKRANHAREKARSARGRSHGGEAP